MKQMQTACNSNSFSVVAWATAPVRRSEGFDASSRPERGKPEPYLAARAVEVLSLLSIWWSAQTAVWIACGLGGLVLVFLNWLLLSRIASLLPRLTERATAGALPALPQQSDSDFVSSQPSQMSQGRL